MKEYLPIFFVLLFFAINYFIIAISNGDISLEDINLNPNDYARITDVEYKAVVVDEPDSRGKVVVTERLTFDVHAASEDNLFWELWRDLPEDTVDGLTVEYSVNSVKQILEDGTEINYEESPILYWDDYDYVNDNPVYGPGKWYHSEGPYDEDYRQYECVFFYVDGLYREEVVFEIEYEMYNAAFMYNDCSDLYLQLYSEDTIKYLNSYKAEILFPDEDMPAPGNYDVFTYGTNSNEFPYTESDTLYPGYHTFSIELDEEQLQFKPFNEYIEFELVAYGDDKHIFTEYADPNIYAADDVLEEIYYEQQQHANAQKKAEKNKVLIFILSLLGSIIILIRAFTTKSRLRKKHTFYQPAMEMDYYKEIPSNLDPNFAAALVFCKDKTPKDDSAVYSALLLSLAQKKYISLTEYGSDDVQITILKKTFTSVRPAMNTYSFTKEPMDIYPQPTDTFGQPSDIYGNSASTYEQPTDIYGNSASTYEQPADIHVNSASAYEQPTAPYAEPEYTYEPLTLCEEYYFNLLTRHAINDSILMSTFQARVAYDYQYTGTFSRNMQKSIVKIGTSEGYFQKADYEQPQRSIQSSSNLLMFFGILMITLVNILLSRTRLELAFGAFFIAGISCIISSVYLKRTHRNYVLLTQFGENEYAKWRGLYNYLNNNNLMNERSLIDLPIWEKYLVYATAFGISDKVIDAIGINCPEAGSSEVLNNRYYRSRHFRHSGRSFRISVHSGSSFSGGGGGGGSRGGGGRGGGGGGGGH